MGMGACILPFDGDLRSTGPVPCGHRKISRPSSSTHIYTHTATVWSKHSSVEHPLRIIISRNNFKINIWRERSSRPIDWMRSTTLPDLLSPQRHSPGADSFREITSRTRSGSRSVRLSHLMAKEEEATAEAHQQQLYRQELNRKISSRNRCLSSSFSSAFSDISSCSASSTSSPSSTPTASLSDVTSLISDLDSDDLDLQLNAAATLRLLARDNSDNRLLIAKAGAALPLVSLLPSSDSLLQEHAVTALLNLSLLDLNKPVLAAAGAVPALLSPLRSGSPAARANAANALLRLSQLHSLRPSVTRSGALPLLVDLLRTGDLRGRKDAATALYTLCSSSPADALRAVRAGVVRVLLDLVSEGEPGVGDKAAYVLATVSTVTEAREEVVAEGGVAVLVDLLEEGTPKQKEAAADILLRVCEESASCRSMAAREGAVPALAAVARSGSTRAKKKAEALLELLKVGRAGSVRDARVLELPA